ncbi:L-iditol 2-dehydrogenase [Hydrogenispora ethanolica]|uniref:L-iditol 2-dehydrogenase n=1 Tax=Hydrogenispora ethanolica TaxID=1082276 RepID=A0A4R1SB60_HYDET|nr:alcohol dehydrogenase catalytic domain-containing protein [Hydrogenispora ethanolica]TCL76484.1 L-iditol 2-dehydrogenase [Hydrogenispora ethanolica]
MLQAVMVKPGMIEFRNVPVPEINAEEVLIEMKRIGVCGSDIHVYHGKHPYTSYPVVQGHEVSGVIVKLGAKVAGFKPGDKVTIQPQVCCGRCYSCRHGKYHICDDLKVMGFQTTGAASEYFAVAAAKVVKLPDEMSFDAGAMIEPLAVAVHALSRAGMNLKGLNVLVLGAGPIGNLVAQAARGMGAAAVMITDISGYRLGIAESCGIDYCLNPEQQNLGTMLADQFGADKADLILECVGANPTMNQAIEYARKGSSIIVVGVFGDRANLDMGLVQDRELQLIGTLMYQEQDYLQAIELVKEGQVRLEPLITNHFPFQDYQKAYEFIEDRKDRTMKVIIALNDH